MPKFQKPRCPARHPHIEDALVARLPNISGRQKWRERITEAWQGQVETIFGIGNLLEAAKEELPHGEWLKMIKEELPFKATTAQRLKAISTNDNIRNAAHVQCLPAAWGTLYELTKLTDEQFQSGIDSGVINPRMERKDVRALRGVAPKERKKAPVAPAGRPRTGSATSASSCAYPLRRDDAIPSTRPRTLRPAGPGRFADRAAHHELISWTSIPVAASSPL